MGRRWTGIAAGIVAVITLAGAPSAAAADEPQRLPGAAAQPAHEGAAPADTLVPMPDLGIAHRRPDGGINLFRMSLSDLESDFATPHSVRGLPGFSYDRSRTVTGDFADVTASDDGTADHLIWQAASDGSVRLYGVGGGHDTAPRLWQTLRAPWSWANSRLMVGDVNGDGWDDLVVRHKAGCSGAYCYVNAWALLSNGVKLGAPQLWLRQRTGAEYLDGNRHLLADMDGDLDADWVTVRPVTNGVQAYYRASTGTAFSSTATPLFTQTGGGWSYAASRQLAGDVTGDGNTDIVTVHRAGTDRLKVWVHPGGTGAAVGWQDLYTGAWSYAGSRQNLADVDADGDLDLITVHRTSTGGMIVWEHPSSGTAFGTPTALVNLHGETGWRFAYSRDGVANTWGILTTP